MTHKRPNRTLVMGNKRLSCPTMSVWGLVRLNLRAGHSDSEGLLSVIGSNDTAATSCRYVQFCVLCFWVRSSSLIVWFLWYAAFSSWRGPYFSAPSALSREDRDGHWVDI